jgi:hypothetical protein
MSSAPKDTRDCRPRIHNMVQLTVSSFQSVSLFSLLVVLFYCVLCYAMFNASPMYLPLFQENRDELFAKAYDVKLKIIGSNDT